MIDIFSEHEFQQSIQHLIIERNGAPVGYADGFDDYDYFTLRGNEKVFVGDVLINECGSRYKVYDVKIERSPGMMDTKSAYYEVDAAVSCSNVEEIAAIHEAVAVLKEISVSVKPPEQTKLQSVAATVAKFSWIAELVNSESVHRLLDQLL